MIRSPNVYADDRFARLLQILTILQSGHNCKMDDLVAAVNTSRRTVFRDLKVLRLAGIPFSHDKKNCSYKLAPSYYNTSTLNLSTQEALGLLLLAYKARHRINLPFSDAILRAILKIEGALPTEVRSYCNRRLQYIGIKNFPQIKTEFVGKLFSQLLDATAHNRVLHIQYYVPAEKKNVPMTLHPYQLYYGDCSWYLLGWSSLQEQVCVLKLNQIKEVTQSGECFIKDKRFDINDYLGRAWSMRRGRALYSVRLWFAPDIAPDIASVQWHSTQMEDFQEDGSVIIEFRIDGLDEVIPWILSYGEKISVLAPQVLRKKIAEIAKNTLRASKGKTLICGIWSTAARTFRIGTTGPVRWSRQSTSPAPSAGTRHAGTAAKE